MFRLIAAIWKSTLPEVILDILFFLPLKIQVMLEIKGFIPDYTTPICFITNQIWKAWILQSNQAF